MNENENKNEKSIGTRIMEIPYWYHRIELPEGNYTSGWAPLCPEKYGIPDDMTGMRVLDVGAWDGYWTWEAFKRGAKEVVAIDDFSDNCGKPGEVKRKGWESFDLCAEAFGFMDGGDVKAKEGWKVMENDKRQVCKRITMDIYGVVEKLLGRFDVVFAFGIIYHLKYPLLGLHQLANVCDGEIYLETAALDDYSPYKNVEWKGYNKNEMVMEFYPEKQYGNNESNWWVPTLQCLGAMVQSAGFKDVRAWGLTDNPEELSQCRGFVYGSKTGVVSDNVKKLSDGEEGKPKNLKIAAVMSVPRLGFQDNSFCCFEGLVPLGIPLQKTTGAYWGQCLERAIQIQIDTHNCDAVLTIDYDTLFKLEDVKELRRLMIENPEADAIVSLQMGRGSMGALVTAKTKTGQVREIIEREEFLPDTLKIATGHFGLTLIRTESLLKLPHPWFDSKPNSDGQWEGGRIDADIYFWKEMEKAGMNVFLANRVVIGHLELVAKWPDVNLHRIYQLVSDWHSKGKPDKVWK